MATVVNERDTTIQAAPTRLKNVSLGSNFQVGQSSVTGLDAIVSATKQIWLAASSQVVQISKAGANSPANITLTANVRNLTAAPSLTITSGTMSVTPALTSGSFTFTPAQMTTDVVSFRLTLTESGVTYTDDMTVAKVREGADGLTGLLTNESMTLPADSSGVVSSYIGAGGAFRVYSGAVDVTSSCTFAVAANTDSLTVSLVASGASAGQYSITAGYPTGKSLVSVTLRATYGATTIDKIVTVAKANNGATGATGAAGSNATAYWITTSAGAVSKSAAGVYGTSTVTFSGYSATGTGSPAPYSGLFVIATTADGATWTDRYTSAANEASKAYTLIAGIQAVRCRQYLAGATPTTLVDEISVPIVNDGQAGVSAILSNESHTFPSNAAGAVTTYTGSGTTIRVYEGVNEIPYDGVGTANSSWKVTTSALNIAVGVLTDSGTYLTVGDHSGVADLTDNASITYTITGKTSNGTAISFTKVQTFGKSKTGASGANTTGVVLSNSAHVFAASSSGAVSSYTGSGTEVWVYDGATALAYDGVGTANGTFNVTASGTNITPGAKSDGGSQAIFADSSGITAAAASITYTVTGKTPLGVGFSLTAVQRFTKASAGVDGTSYWLVRSANSVSRDPAGLYTPPSLTFSAMSSTGATPAAYTGRFVIATTADGTTFSDVYTSAANESTKLWTIPTGIKAFRVRLYKSITDATLLDEEITAIFSSALGGNLIDNSVLDATASTQSPPVWGYVNGSGVVSGISGVGISGTVESGVRFKMAFANILTLPEADTPTEMWSPSELSYPTGTVLSVDTTVYSTAPSSYKLTKANTTTASQGVTHMPRLVGPGEVYRVHVLVRGDTASANGLYIRVNELNAIPTTWITSANRTSFTTLASNVAVTTTFTLLSFTYTVPAGVYGASFTIFSHYAAGTAQGPATLYFDEPVMNLSSGADLSAGQRQTAGTLYIGGTTIPINPAKTYRIVIPLAGYANLPSALPASMARDVAVLRLPANSVCTLNTTTVLTSATTVFSIPLDMLSRLSGAAAVFYIFAAGTTTNSEKDSGIYAMVTGDRVASLPNYCWNSSTVSTRLALSAEKTLYNSSLYVSTSYVHVVDGSEPLLKSLVYDPPGLSASKYWEFSNTLDGWVATNATTAVGASSVTLTATTASPQFLMTGLSIPHTTPLIRIRIKRLAGTGWAGKISFTTTASPAFSADKALYCTMDPTAGNSGFVVANWRTTADGGTYVTTSNITSLRLELGNTIGDSFEIDWVSVGAVNAGGILPGAIASSQLALGSATQIYQITGGQYSATGGTTTVVDKITFMPDVDCDIVVTFSGDCVKSGGTSMSTGATSGALAVFFTQNGSTSYSQYRGITTSLPAAATALEQRFSVVAGSFVDAGLYFGSAAGINATIYSAAIKVELIKR